MSLFSQKTSYFISYTKYLVLLYYLIRKHGPEQIVSAYQHSVVYLTIFALLVPLFKALISVSKARKFEEVSLADQERTLFRLKKSILEKGFSL